VNDINQSWILLQLLIIANFFAKTVDALVPTMKMFQ
jgi:hypothetical protein